VPKWREPTRTARGPSRTHPQKGAEDRRTIKTRPQRAAVRTSVSFCVLLWMHCRFARRSQTKITSTTDFTDHTDDNRPDSPIRALRAICGSNLRAQNRLFGRKSDDVRAQNAGRHRSPKLCPPIDLRSNMKTCGRSGRKIPEHLVVASGQWPVARLEARRHLAVSATRTRVQ
jgi:hypothetical protein